MKRDRKKIANESFASSIIKLKLIFYFNLFIIVKSYNNYK